MPERFIINISRVLNILLLMGAGPLLAAFQPAKNEPVQLVLRNEAQKIKLADFAINEVDDNTPKDTNFGNIFAENSKQLSHIILKGGVAKAIKNYLDASTVVTGKARTIHISVKKLVLTETTTNGKAVDGELQVQFGFDLIIGDKLYKHLIDYKGTVRYARLPNQTGAADTYIRMGIQNSVAFFKDWLERNKNNNAVFANSVKLVFKDYRDGQPEEDTIYYSPKRPLTWDDFQDKLTAHGGYTAEVIPGLGFTESKEVINGQLIIEMQLKIYLPKSAAFVRAGDKNDYNLNHEQRHFDVVKIISDRLKKTLLAENLPVQNYDGYINVDYFDALRQITAMQRQYDNETAHGSNKARQEEWNRKIDAELTGGVSGS